MNRRSQLTCLFAIVVVMTFASCTSSKTVTNVQNGLRFNGEAVVSLSIRDYNQKNNLLQFSDSIRRKIIVKKRVYNEYTSVFHDVLDELQLLLYEIGNDGVPTAEDFGIDEKLLKERIDETNQWLPERYISVKMLNEWLMEEYSNYVGGLNWIKIHTGPPCGIRIIVRTEKESYYFDMDDEFEFQPYWMRTSSKNCFRSIVNFNVNRHLIDIFNVLRIKRKVHWRDDIIDKYVSDCALKMFE